jgi:transposase
LRHARVAEVNRLQKTLEGANSKLATIASDITGRSGRDMLAALVAGTTDAAALAHLARGALRAKIPLLAQALAGHFAAHQRFLVAQQLAHLDFLDALVDRVSAEITERLRPVEETLLRLETIPGVGRWSAEVLVAELGTDMGRFPTAGHLASWAGLCPGNNESAGKRQSGRTRKGSPWLRTVLVEAAQAASTMKHSYLAAQYHRLAAKRGAKRATIAVAHPLIVLIHAMLTRREAYHDIGGHYFEERDRQAAERRLVRRLEALGYAVALAPLVPVG